MRKTIIAALAGIAALAVACGGTAGSAAPTTTPTQTTTASPPTNTAPATTTTPGTPATTPPTSAPTTQPAPASCAWTTSWGTGTRQLAGWSRDALYLVRAGRHDCFDRVVFDINGGAAVGYSVSYVPVVTTEGSGTPLPVPGTATLDVVVRAPELGFDDQGHAPGRILANPGDYLYGPSQLAGWTSLRAVRFAGFFEGQCSFAVGVRAKVPFRVFTLLDPDGAYRHVVVDIAH